MSCVFRGKSSIYELNAAKTICADRGKSGMLFKSNGVNSIEKYAGR